MRKGTLLLRSLLVTAAAAAFFGCKSPPARFYTLTPMAAAGANQPAQRLSAAAVVNIAPVEIPDYLDRPQIATRQGANGIKLAEYDRWAGSLSDNISSVLAEDLALQLGTSRVFVAPGAPFDKADYSVVMRILRLDLVPGGKLLLKAQWTLFTAADKKGTMHLSSLTRNIAGKSYDAVVAAVDQAVAELGGEVAKAITTTAAGEIPK